MPTNSIGVNNALIGVCVPKEVKTILGREATAENRSIANLIFNAAVEHFRAVKPAVAAQIEAARAEHLRVIRSSTCLLIGLLSVAASMFGGVDMRRASTRVRPVTSNVRRIEA
jgi:hypothetical protein